MFCSFVRMNQDTINSPPTNDLLEKRKRGRPHKDETLLTPKLDINLVGKGVSGVVEGSFDAGYLLNVKVKDNDIKLRGLVFIPGKVTPITSENDVAPLAKMYGREEIKNDQTDQSLHNDQPMKDDVTTHLEMSESARALSLVPQENNEKFAVQTKEAMMEKNGVIEEAATRLVDFFPTPETMMTTGQPNLVLVQKEIEQQKSPGETRGFDLMAEEPVCQGEKVPEELQLELGNKTKATPSLQ
ncbi:Protein METABOLIC NETWORK MODULATOR 1 [Cardamine amara subsp. amara]|uniref:Protein METABOLIC NETWORK MODULATOR 1 n=1 Tax=Cardamine amara subsp. amara TaxID=228776 RepID=A0ABD1A6P8_CARAN